MPTPRQSLLAALLASLLAAEAWGAVPPQPLNKLQLPKPPPGAPPPAGKSGAPIPPLTEEDQKGPDRRKMAAKGLFQLDFDKVDIDKLVQEISNLTGKLFILGENVRGKITVIGPDHGKAGVSVDEAYAAFLAALDANNLTVYPVGRFLKIVEKRSGKQSNIPTLLEDAPYTTNEQMVTKMFKLRYVDAEPIRAVLQQLVSRDGDTIAFPPDTIIINDIGLNMHRLERILERLDSPTSQDEIRVIAIQYASATDIAEKLKQVFEEKGAKKPGGAHRPGQANVPGAPPPPQPGAPPAATAGGEEGSVSLSQLIPDERTNKLIVIGNEKAFRRITELLKHLDAPISGEGQVHVYYLENANAEEMASTLASLTQGLAKGGKPGAPPPGGAKGPATVADLFSGEVKITADKATNSLVVIANSSDYRNLLRVVQKLDRPRRQVFIEAVIMEVNLSNHSELGMSVHAGKDVEIKNPSDSVAVLGSQIGSAKSIGGIIDLAKLGGFLAGLQGPLIPGFPLPSFAIVLHALQDSSDVNVLSTPHILTTDNEDAEITVGQNIPFQAGITSPLLSTGLSSLTSGTTGANNPLATSALTSSLMSGLIAPIQRQNVELKLKLKPQINEGDFIRLQVDEQTEDIAEKNAQLGPTTNKRTAKTTVIARDQQTVVIGGLIQERTIRSVQKVPLLGDIPVLGWLFRSTDTTKTRTNLLLFLTPYIIRGPDDFRNIFERKLKERQEFVEQFYGRQPGYDVPIDYANKAGPLARMLRTLSDERQKAENGGPGIGGERPIAPKRDLEAPDGPPPPAAPDAPALPVEPAVIDPPPGEREVTPP